MLGPVATTLLEASLVPLDGLDDSALMERVQQRDAEAFAVLVDRHSKRLVGYLSHMAGGRQRAEEVAQEAFLRVWNAADAYDDRGRFTPWLYRIATNLAISEARRRKRWNERVDRVRAFWRPDPTPEPADTLQGRDEQAAVQAALATLPEEFRAAVVLREIEGWSYADVAGTLGVPEGTIKSRVNRGKAQLRVALASYWEDADHA